MANPELVKVPDPEPDYTVPESITITEAPDFRLTPNDMRALKAETGKRLTELTGEDADEADSMQTMAWLYMRRAGNPVPWSALGDVTIIFEVPEPDPTNAEPSTNSPPSAGSGDAPPAT